MKWRAFTLILRKAPTLGGKKAFTLIELLIVISIIGILITLVAVTVRPIQLKGRDARRKSDLNLYLAGLDLFKTDFKLYPNHTFYLGKNTLDTGAATSSLELGNDISGCQGLGAGNPTNFSVATDFTTASSDYNNAILKPGFAAVNHFMICLKYVDRLVADPTYGSTSSSGYQYRVSYDYVDVLVGAKLENTNDPDPKYLFNSSPSAEKRYYLGSGGTVRHLDDDSDSDSTSGGTANEYFFGTAFGGLRPILNGKYLYQCNGKAAIGDIKRDDRALTANEPITYTSNAWRANTTACADEDTKIDDIQSW